MIEYGVIENAGISNSLKGYWEDVAKAYQEKRFDLVQQFESMYNRQKIKMETIDRAIRNAPPSNEPLILYRGQRELGSADRGGGNDPLFVLNALSTPIGTSFMLPEDLSFDNNLSLSLFGRAEHRGGYYGELCCFWPVYVPIGTPLLFVERRDHVLVPRGSTLTILDKTNHSSPCER